MSLKNIREQKGFTQAELEAASGVDQSTISSYENETRKPSLETARALAKALGVSPEEIFPVKENGTAA